ncbi:ChbG/HpnK family deacetylase [Rhizobium sp. BK251]|uniref:ChbG/HpnK family deacetylase n=1 Tax=Rhizobium sp. BK251 TaxID=2512125 RepID=UPI00104AD3DE|nr:ChbG/HpnK family deacetylase [Rhizobium sp. BK251]TCL73543.1 hypothetical protein EV286_10372 [Rhizobium sp. BK251]
MSAPAREASKPVWLVADDYGLSPAIGEGIRSLIAARRISGTGCMTLFPEWPDEARLLKSCTNIGHAVIGLHLTLTDFPPLTGESEIAPDGRMQPVKTVVVQSCLQKSLEPLIHEELDAQLDAFVAVMGHMPHYIDGHQHVHFLPPVRSWFSKRIGRFMGAEAVPWLRGEPSVSLVEGLVVKSKVTAICLLGAGFDKAMRAVGYDVVGPLAGFYDWSGADDFASMLKALRPQLPEGAVVMCHPGDIDTVLIGRDRLVEPRKTELEVLAQSQAFNILDRSSLAVAGSMEQETLPGRP